MGLTLGGIAGIGGAIVMTGGARSAALPWLVVPVVAATAVFTSRGVAVALAAAVFTALASTRLAGASALVAAPEYVAATIVLIASVGLYVNGLMRAEVRHRGESVLDPLTGLLNRATLGQRFEEVRQQAALVQVPVAFVLFDLDRFKDVNDTYGHEAGDAVLRDVAYEMRKALRSFELAYRVGGEELLLILPGTDEGERRARRARAPPDRGEPPGRHQRHDQRRRQRRGRRRRRLRTALRARGRAALRGQGRRARPRHSGPGRSRHGVAASRRLTRRAA